MKKLSSSISRIGATLTATLALGLALTVAPARAAAPAPAIDFTSPTIDFTNGTWSLGWAFSTNVDVDVTALGFYDDNKDGLKEAHRVGIFDSAQNLLVHGVVNPADSLTGWFRYTDVKPITLAAGHTYVIGATTGPENYTWDPTGFTVNPAIHFIEDRFKSSTNLDFPDQSSGVQGWFGPNFLTDSVAPIDGSPVPEPASLALLATGALPLLRRLRRRSAGE